MLPDLPDAVCAVSAKGGAFVVRPILRIESMNRETGLELADWLAHMQRVGQTLAHLDAGRQHLAKLALW